MSLPVQFDLDRNLALLGGQGMVFHCHHYNCALQKAIEDGLGDDAPALLASAAHRTVHDQLRALAPDASPEETLAQARAAYAELGFGVLDTKGLGADGGEAVVDNSHYAMGWLVKYGPRETPVDHFSRGFLTAAFAAAHRVAIERVRVRQTRCMTVGDARNAFTIEVTP